MVKRQRFAGSEKILGHPLVAEPHVELVIGAFSMYSGTRHALPAWKGLVGPLLAAGLIYDILLGEISDRYHCCYEQCRSVHSYSLL